MRKGAIEVLVLTVTAVAVASGTVVSAALSRRAGVAAWAPAMVRPTRRPTTNAAGSRIPFEGDTQGDTAAVAEGAKLFVGYNCDGCHGAEGSGAMGPSLQDNRWRFGGSASDVYRSIAEGRPEGMPAWGPLVPAEHIGKLVAYVRTLGTGRDLTTENFTREGAERMGR